MLSDLRTADNIRKLGEEDRELSRALMEQGDGAYPLDKKDRKRILKAIWPDTPDFLVQQLMEQDEVVLRKRLRQESAVRGNDGVYPVFLNIRNPKVRDWEDQSWTAANSIEKWLIERRDATNDGVIAENIRDGQYAVASNVYVVFKPEQIKSAIANNGGFDGESEDIRFRLGERRVSGGGFFSTVENALAGIRQEKGTPEQFKAMLLKGGAAQAEMDWLGWDEFASGRKAVTKADVQAWTEENGIVLGEDAQTSPKYGAKVQTVELNDEAGTVQALPVTEKMRQEAPLGMPLFRMGDSRVPAQDEAKYERVRKELADALSGFSSRFWENHRDNMLPVKMFFELLRKEGMDIPDEDDLYMRVTAVPSINMHELEEWDRNVYGKLQEGMNTFMGRTKMDGLRQLENYAMAKSGLERNEVFSNEERTVRGKKGKYRKDWSGLGAIMKEVDGKEYPSLDETEEAARAYVNRIESTVDATEVERFWDTVREATEFSLRKLLEGGRISLPTFDFLTKRQRYYLPFRGHAVEDTAFSMYGYETGGDDMVGHFSAPVLSARGRKTRAITPFAYIHQLGESAITQSNRNALNQAILRLARKDKTGLLSVNKVWYKLDSVEDGQPVYVKASPAFSEDPVQYRQNVADFNEQMRELEKEGKAFQSRSRLNVGGLFIKPAQAQEHEVHVWENGEEYVVYINADPRIARAINGTNNYERRGLSQDDERRLNKYVLHAIRNLRGVQPGMAKNFTTRSPVFVVSNTERDWQYASAVLLAKEGVKYTAAFEKNWAPALAALTRYEAGKADLSKEADRYVQEFMANGGRTGYTQMLELEAIQRKIDRFVDKGDQKGVLRTAVDALSVPVKAVGNGLGHANTVAENTSRVATYMTSRKQGRSLIRSISDAKEVTTNFNRRGAGGMGADFVTRSYLFSNASVQGMFNTLERRGGRAVAVGAVRYMSELVAAFALGGTLMPMVAAGIGGDDKEEEYFHLTDWERWNNMCIPNPGGFLKIPLAQSLRPFWRIGDNMYRWYTGRMDGDRALLSSITGLLEMMPDTPLTGASQGSLAESAPSVLKPMAQLIANRDFKGSLIYDEWANENMPGWRAARRNKRGELIAPESVYLPLKWLDIVTGGDGVERGWISVNPDKAYHLARGYFGTMFQTGMEGIELMSGLAGFTEDGNMHIKPKGIPLAGAFYKAADDMPLLTQEEQHRYYEAKKDIKERVRKYKDYKKQTEEGASFANDFDWDRIWGKITPEVAQILMEMMQGIEDIEQGLKQMNSTEEQLKLERQLAGMRRDVTAMYRRYILNKEEEDGK